MSCGERPDDRDLRVGDGVDLPTLPGGYPLGDVTRSVAEVELAEVVGENDGSPFTVESATTWVLWTDQGGLGVDPDWEVEVDRP
ncbi:MAG: hypothetical protein ABW022_03210 [Actinoplanes sp.]